MTRNIVLITESLRMKINQGIIVPRPVMVSITQDQSGTRVGDCRVLAWPVNEGTETLFFNYHGIYSSHR